jgi:hypothetical protein
LNIIYNLTIDTYMHKHWLRFLLVFALAQILMFVLHGSKRPKGIDFVIAKIWSKGSVCLILSVGGGGVLDLCKKGWSAVYNKLPTIVTLEYQFHTFQCACVNPVFVQLNGHYNSSYVHDRPVVIIFFPSNLGGCPAGCRCSEKLHLLRNFFFLGENMIFFFFLMGLWVTTILVQPVVNWLP